MAHPYMTSRFPHFFGKALAAAVIASAFSIPLQAVDTKAATTEPARKVKLKGVMVDVSCSIEQKEDPNYMRTKHSKKCFQMPACVKSGYAILTQDDKVIRFDAPGNALAQKLMAGTTKENDFRIVVRGKLTGDELAVNKLELEK
jgi:hypothetical protein